MAESCTGGFLAHRITNVPGASAVFLAGYVTYANEAKAAALGVDPRSDREARRGERSRSPADGGRRAASGAAADVCAGHDGNRRSGRRFGGEAGWNGICRPARRRAEKQRCSDVDFAPTAKVSSDLATQAALEMLRRTTCWRR